MQVSINNFNNFGNYLLKINSVSYCGVKNFATKLQEVGRFETPIRDGSYKAGQTFLHKLLAYRGIILFPWIAQVCDRTLAQKVERFKDSDESSKMKSSTGESSKIFYNVLIDSRDSPFIRSHTEVVTFFDDEESGQGLVLIPGMDHVAHNNILPYKSTEEQPLQHEMISKFFTFNPDFHPSFVAKNSLRVWEKKNHSWLDATKVQHETTEGVRVTVIPFYMGCRKSQYWWRYNICLENLSDLSVQLTSRHWRIFTDSGALEVGRGRGVMGQEIILSRKEPVFQYCSHVSLDEPSGHMLGSFTMQREDGTTFDCVVPSFTLESRQGAMTPPDHLTG